MFPVLAGLPVPFVNVPLVDTEGMPIGIPDLLLVHRDRRIGLEYDGAYHDQDDQPAADRRANRVALGDLPLLRYDARSVLRERQLPLTEMSTALGVRPSIARADRDFARPPASRSW